MTSIGLLYEVLRYSFGTVMSFTRVPLLIASICFALLLTASPASAQGRADLAQIHIRVATAGTPSAPVVTPVWDRTAEPPAAAAVGLTSDGLVVGPGDVVRHPSQLYEALFEGLILFLILLWATHRAKLGNRRGVIAGIFILFYGVFRIAIETVRQPDAGLENLPLGLTMGMYLSIPMVLGGAYLIWRGMREPLPPALSAPASPAAAKTS